MLFWQGSVHTFTCYSDRGVFIHLFWHGSVHTFTCRAWNGSVHTFTCYSDRGCYHNLTGLKCECSYIYMSGLKWECSYIYMLGLKWECSYIYMYTVWHVGQFSCNSDTIKGHCSKLIFSLPGCRQPLQGNESAHNNTLLENVFPFFKFFNNL